MSDDAIKVREEMSDTKRQRLDDLNRQIQVQRNIEMHAAMERARLETQRVELMSQMLTLSVAAAGGARGRFDAALPCRHANADASLHCPRRRRGKADGAP